MHSGAKLSFSCRLGAQLLLIVAVSFTSENLSHHETAFGLYGISGYTGGYGFGGYTGVHGLAAIFAYAEEIMKSRVAIAVFVIILLSVPLDMAAQARFITFDAPGDLATTPLSINPAGAITGYFLDANFTEHGFLRERHGTIITFDVQGAVATLPFSINPAGVIAGWYADTNFVAHGFLRERHGIITFDATRNVNTFPSSINPEGTITGEYIDANFVSHGFLREHLGTIITFDAPGVGPGGGPNSEGTHASSINPAGAITGSYDDANNVSHAFLREPDGKFTTFEAPGAGTSPFFGTFAASINPAGSIAGYYSDGSQVGIQVVYHGFLREPDGKITTFDVPGAVAVFTSSINPAGVIVGYGADTNEVAHGFLRRPDGSITTFDAPGAGTSPFDGTYPFSINPAGVITGPAEVSGITPNIPHGFLRIPCERDDERECEHPEDGGNNCSCDPNVR